MKTNMTKSNSIIKTVHADVQDVLLDIVDILNRAGAHYVITRDLAIRLKEDTYFDGINKIVIVSSINFINDKHALDLLKTFLINFHAQITEKEIRYSKKGIEVVIKFKNELHDTLRDPDFANVLNEKIPIPNPFDKYLKVKNFI